MTAEGIHRGRSGLSWGQAGAALAGVLSLIFVGWEIRQNTIAVRGSTYQAVADANVDWLMFLAENPDLSQRLQRWASGDTTLSVQEIGQARILRLAFWRTIENAHYQYVLGNLPEEAFRRWVPTLTPVTEKWWQGSRDRFTPAFQAYVDSVGASGTSGRDDVASDPDTTR